MLKMLKPVSAQSKLALETLSKALAIREIIEKAGLNPEIRLRKSGTDAVLQMSLRSRNVAEMIRQLVKLLETQFDKKASACGFLLYEANIQGIIVKVNTGDCFFGGKPQYIAAKERTKAYCKLPNAESEAAEA